jgi:hypothetical protein
MLKRRTIAMLVAGTLIGAQAGIAANDQETTVDTYLLVPAEQTIVLEPTTLSESDVSGQVTDVIVIEEVAPATIYIAEADPSRYSQPLASRDRTASLTEPTASLPSYSSEMPFKGHPMNVSETAGWSLEEVGGSKHFARTHGVDHRAAARDYRSAESFPMNVSESAGISNQALERDRLAHAASSDFQVASASQAVGSPRVE